MGNVMQRTRQDLCTEDNMAQLTKAPDLRLSVAATLPPAVTIRLLGEVDEIARRMTRQIVSGISLPDSRFRTLGYFRTVTAACRDALRTFVRLLRDGRGLRAGDLERLGSMGAQQAELEVPLELVFGAYRLAARVLWDEIIGQPALLNDVPPSTVINVTSTVLEYFDEISAAVGRAYLETRERLLRQRDRDRDRILQRLLGGDASPELRRTAASADLTLLPPYWVVACAAPTTEAERELEEVWRGEGAHLIGDDPGLWIALVPEGRDLERLCASVGPVVFGVGPVAATLDEVAPAAQQARRALDVGRRLYPDRSVHTDAEVGVFAALAADFDAMRSFVDRVLGPLAAGTPSRRLELVATLEALLDSRSIGEAAERLGVHRHTVVYRISRLRQLGIDTDDPTQRHHLWLALRCMCLLDGPTVPLAAPRP
jgi:PucR C-terminal helix-turn-helix domain/GGDEF-like domain